MSKNQNWFLRDGIEEDALSIASEYWRHQASNYHLEKVKSALRNYPSKIAEKEGSLIGFVYCRKFAPDILEIDNLFVNEEFRDRGLGSSLLAELESQAGGNYSGLILTNSSLYNNPVVDKRDPSSLYGRHGFKLVFSTKNSRVFAKGLDY